MVEAASTASIVTLAPGLIDCAENTVEVRVVCPRAEDDLITEPTDVFRRLELRSQNKRGAHLRSANWSSREPIWESRRTRALMTLLQATCRPSASQPSRTTPKLPAPSTTSSRTTYWPNLTVGGGIGAADGGNGGRGEPSESENETRDARAEAGSGDERGEDDDGLSRAGRQRVKSTWNSRQRQFSLETFQ